MTSPLGPIITRWQIEGAVLTTIETWLETYLSEVERQVFDSTAAVIPRPPAPSLQQPSTTGTTSGLPTSIHGGVDTLTADTDLMPEIIVTVQPQGDPTHYGSGDYTSEFELAITTLIYGEMEDLARMFADLYGAALKALILQEPTIGGLTERVRLSQEPKSSFVDTDATDSQLVQSVVLFDIYVTGSVNDLDFIPEPVDGDTLGDPDPSQLPPDWPEVETVNITVTPESLAD